MVFSVFNLLVQHASLSPDGKLLAIVGDNPEGLIVDPNTGKVHICGPGHKCVRYSNGLSPRVCFIVPHLWNFCRRWKHYQDTWTFPLPLRGIRMESLSLQETKIRLVVYGTSVTYLSLLLS